MYLMLLQALTFTFGLVTALYGIASAIVERNPYWYSFFTVGSYLLFAILNRAFAGKSTLPGPGGGNLVNFLKTYSAFFVIGFVIDIIYGRFIGKNWIYPHFGLMDEILNVLVIGYPFAFFSVLETFFLLRHCLQTIAGPRPQPSRPPSPQILRVILAIALTALSLPFTVPLWPSQARVNEVVFICMLLTTFLFDSMNGLRSRFSLLVELLTGNTVVLLALVATSALAGIAHEVPNTYAREWVYQNVPFTDQEVWGVNILILTFGWFFLVVIPISVYSLVTERLEID